jgi:hypothetical protein
VDFDQSRSTGYGKMCNVDLGLLVVISVCYTSITVAFLAPDLLAEQLNHRD